ncbi:hypothetical protein [Brevundimonas sp.]|uniref:hypothetical protein n=1 Tax=Brevundimonas sp. TaxID=1871086 RepID=UPI0028A1672F|nr:hypothetical protein [Brevundimonas sp.]
MPTLSPSQKLEAAERTIAALIEAGETNGCPDIRDWAIAADDDRYGLDALGGAVMGYLSHPPEDGDDA